MPDESNIVETVVKRSFREYSKRKTIVANARKTFSFYVMLASVVLSIFSGFVLYYHAFQLKLDFILTNFVSMQLLS